MEPLHVAAALFSALLHAGWNAAVKASPDPGRAMTAQMLLAGLIVSPGLFWTGPPDVAAVPWIAASTATNFMTVTVLLKAYAAGGFGVVYPTVRAVTVLLVVPLAAIAMGEAVGPLGLLGVVLIVASLAVLALDGRSGGGLGARAFGWTLLAGLGTAAFILCDAQGVRAAGSPLSYGFTVSITNAMLMCWRRRADGAPWTRLRADWRIGLPAGVASSVSYLLILWVWSAAPVALATALRDTSAVFAILIAIFWLREPFTLARVLAVVLATAAVPLLRLG